MFLDEIGDMPLEMQAKLLRVLQTGEIKPWGLVTRKVRVRVIAATNRDLEKALGQRVQGGSLLPLQHVHHHLPPLRDRTEDFPVLAHHFLRKAEAKVNSAWTASPEALDSQALSVPAICASSRTSSSARWCWPRVARSRSLIFAAPAGAGAVTLRAGEGFLQARARTLALFERDAIGRCWPSARNVSVAARRAGITRRNLHRSMNTESNKVFQE